MCSVKRKNEHSLFKDEYKYDPRYLCSKTDANSRLASRIKLAKVNMMSMTW